MLGVEALLDFSQKCVVDFAGRLRDSEIESLAVVSHIQEAIDSHAFITEVAGYGCRQLFEFVGEQVHGEVFGAKRRHGLIFAVGDKETEAAEQSCVDGDDDGLDSQFPCKCRPVQWPGPDEGHHGRLAGIASAFAGRFDGLGHVGNSDLVGAACNRAGVAVNAVTQDEPTRAFGGAGSVLQLIGTPNRSRRRSSRSSAPRRDRIC